MSSSDFDVLIIGGYSLTERAGAATRDKIRLHYHNHLVTQDFIKFFIRNNGDLIKTEIDFHENNKSRLVARSLNSIYLLDFLNKNRVSANVVNYFIFEQAKFRELMSLKPKVAVISTTFISDIQDINRIAGSIKEMSPETVVIVGGIKVLKSFKKWNLYQKNYFQGFDQEIMKKNNFFFYYGQDKLIDIFIIEECGELTLLDTIKKILSGDDYMKSPNIAYYDNGKLNFTDSSKEPYTFEQNLIDWDKIPSDIIGQEVPVRAGIGCPFKCAFCDFTGLHKVKLRTIDNLIEELKLISKAFPDRNIFFTDDNLFTTKKRTKDMAEAILKNGLKFKWRGFFRTDAISEDNVEALAKSGCASCLLGVESGDNTVLKNMNKKTTREQTLKAVKLLNDNGINTLSTIIIGFPGETRGSVDNTIELLNSYSDKDYALNQYWPFVFEILPLALISSPQMREKFKLTGIGEEWKHSTMNSDEAKEELLRCFKEINVPTLQYPEFYDPDIPFQKLHVIFRIRDDIVKNNGNILDTVNGPEIFKKFKNIF